MRAAGRSAGGWNTRRALASGPRHITVMLQCADAGRRVVASGNSRWAAIVLLAVSSRAQKFLDLVRLYW